MTFKQLKESVEDRVKLLEHASTAATVTSAETRLEEARVILDLINRLDAAREEKLDHPLRIVPSITFVGEDPDPNRHDPGKC